MKRNIYGAMTRNYKSLILAISLLFTLSASISGAPGDLDPTFGNGGKRNDWAGYARGVAIQPDGKIVVVGDSCCSNDMDFRVARYNLDGSPDTTFGGGTGRVTTDFNGNRDDSQSVVLQPDGKIIVAGWTVFQSPDNIAEIRLAMARYNPDGSLDTTFGGGSGKVQTPPLYFGLGTIDVAMQPDGKILVALFQYDLNDNDYGLLIRYNADGSPDTSFGMGGSEFPPVVSSQLPIRSVTVQPADGKIVVIEGYLGLSPGIARYNSDGSLDPGFGSGGRVTLPTNFELFSLAIDSAGKIVAAGVSVTGSTFDFALVRFNVDGSPDSTFDGDGIVTTSSLELAYSIVIQSDGKIVAAGYGPGPGSRDLALARYNSNGSLDNTFGGGDGITTVDFNNSIDFGAAVALDSQGRAVVVGGTGQVGGSSYIFAIARFLLGDPTPTPTPTPTPSPTSTPAPGDLDPTFGVGGSVIGSGFGLYDVAIQPDGKIVTVGLWAIARYNVDGSPDTTFGGTGRVFIDRDNQFGIDVAIQPDGRIVVASQDPSGDVYRGEIFRLNSDGSVDTSFGKNGFVGELFLPSVAATLPDGKILITQAGTLSRLSANGSFDTTFSTCDTGGNAFHVPSRAESVIQADGRIVTAVIASAINGYSFGLRRCNPDGGRDTSFGSGGIVATIGASPDGPLSIAIQTDGKIVVTGHSRGQLTVLRYHPNGALDSGFGTGGIATTPTGINSWNKVVIQTNGKIVVATSILNGSKSNFGLVRFNPNGSLDTTFNGTGKVNTPITNGNDDAHSAAIQPDGKIVVVGAGGGGDVMVRYQGDSAAPTSCPNPIDCADFFVRQQYRDFLGREPDPDGFANWMATLQGCANGGYGEFDNPNCDRVHVSAGFVQSEEFQGRGYWILRFGYVGLNRSIGMVRSSATYAEFTPALAQVGGSNSPAQEEVAKVAYANAFVQRSDFLALFPMTMGAAQYVNALESNAQVTLANKQALIDALNLGTMTRADVLRNVVESQVVFDKYIFPAFVTMEYFGYLRRDPDVIGYQNWVNTLTADPNNYRHMIFGFIYSTEYRQRFGAP